MDLEEHLATHFVRDEATGCMLYTGRRDRLGYGRVYYKRQNNFIHRVAYEFVRGKIPQDLVIDHLCRVPSCFNPWHLETVTTAMNTYRGLSGYTLTGTCRSGRHRIESAADYYVTARTGYRECRQCKLERQRLHDQRRAERKRLAIASPLV